MATLPRASASGPRSTGLPPSSTALRLLLVGGGHAHLEVLRRLATAAPPGVAAALVSPHPTHLYTGMITGLVAGEYDISELSFPLEALARRAGAGFVRAAVVGIVADERTVILDDGRRLGYDLASFDVGSGVAGLDLPGVAEHALSVRPLSSLAALAGALDQLPPEGARVLVVGGGAGGVELALCVHARLSRRVGVPAAGAALRDAGHVHGLGHAAKSARVTVVHEGADLLEELGGRAARLARRELRARGVELHLRTRVTAVEPAIARAMAADTEAGLVGTPDHEAGGREAAMPFDVLVWAAGPAALPLFRGSGLPVDADGYLRVGPSLQAVGRREVFGAGDCVTLEGRPGAPRAGAYAVREGPVLWRSIVARLAGAPPPVFRPRLRHLYAMNCGDGRAILGWGGLAVHARWARALKEAIDRRFVRRYLDLLPDSHGRGASRDRQR